MHLAGECAAEGGVVDGAHRPDRDGECPGASAREQMPAFVQVFVAKEGLVGDESRDDHGALFMDAYNLILAGDNDMVVVNGDDLAGGSAPALRGNIRRREALHLVRGECGLTARSRGRAGSGSVLRARRWRHAGYLVSLGPFLCPISTCPLCLLRSWTN